jgi:hypothetical protein
MTNGFGAMLNYSAQVKPEDRWAIAAYIRALQLAQDARLTDVPEPDRGKIREPQMQTTPPEMIAPPGRKATEPQSTTNEQVIGNRKKEGKR